MFRLLIGGDFCPKNRAESELSAGRKIFSDDFKELWSAADVRIANLETPITSARKGIKKAGPNFKASPEIRLGLAELNMDAFSLANNHIMDYGKDGLLDTCSLLEELDISYFGIQKGDVVFDKLMVEKNAVKVCVLSFTSAEFSLASDNGGYGALAIDLIKIIELIESIKGRADHIVILLHAGLYNFELPTRNQRELCQFLIRRGVSAVLCQHSHICGAYETYGDGFICYGQGSFVFDNLKRGTSWNEGYLVSLEFDKVKMRASIHGTRQFDGELNVGLMNSEQMVAFGERLNAYNQILKDASLYDQYFQEMVLKKRREYQRLMFCPPSRLMREFTRMVDIGKIVPDSMKRNLLNLYRNAEHREIVTAILKLDLKE